MGHQHLYILECEAQCLRINDACAVVVDVAIDGTERLHRLKAVRQFQRADITGMPYLVARCEPGLKFLIPDAVGIGEQPYPLHLFRFVALSMIKISTKPTIRKKMAPNNQDSFPVMFS